LAGAFRFVPAVGVWLVAPLPAALGFVGGPGVVTPALVLALFLVLDLLAAHLVVPRVCGRSVGLAPVPLLLAVTFWTGLWGVPGLVLATPLTVCLAVLGKHVRQLGFLSVLLSREAALSPAARYYQRLLARDRPEAEAVMKEYTADHPAEDLFDRVLIPALMLVRRGRRTGELRTEDEEFILRTTRELVCGLEAAPVGTDPSPPGRVVVLGVAAADGVDEVALVMLRHLCGQAGTDVRVATTLSASGAGELGRDTVPAAVLIAAVGPGGLTEARYLCRRLRAQHPGVKIVVGRWGRGKRSRKTQALLLPAGADRIASSLREARAYLTRLAHPLLAPDVASNAV
jgi:hypothetical protein